MGAARIFSRGGRVAQMGLALLSVWKGHCSLVGEEAHMMKNKPAMPPTGTHNASALGSLVVGSSHSSAMDEIMPSAEKLVLLSKTMVF